MPTTINYGLELPEAGEVQVRQAIVKSLRKIDVVMKQIELAGAQGGILSGTGIPAGSLGVDGNIYLDTATQRLYGPKVGGLWGAGSSLIGGTGPQGISAYQVAVNNGFVGSQASWLMSLLGPQGAQGNVGAQGIQGIQGNVGNTGATGLQGIQGNIGNAGSNGTDGVDGADGLTVLNGAVVPTTEGVDGDFYINTATIQIFGPKTSGAWGFGTPLVGPQGIQGNIGNTGPQGNIGAQGIQGIQGVIGNTGANGATGANGLNGLTILNGAVNPNGSQGVDGDFYINTANSQLFGPKTAGAWGAGVSLVGPQGNTGATGAQGIQGNIGNTGGVGPQGIQGIAGVDGLNGNTVLNGITNPVAQGVNGDFYINTANNQLFGPKTAGAWGAGVPLVGPQGIQGIAGNDGAQGLQGIQGIQGIQGNIGNTGNAGAIGPQGIQGIQGITGNTGQGFVIAKVYATRVALESDTAPTGINSGEFAIVTTANANDPDNSRLYLWNGTAYIYISDLSGAQGIQGATGNDGAQGIQGAAGAQGIQGVAGVDGTNGTNGINGKTLLHSTINPTALDGADGDFFLNTTNSVLFGPKASGAWGAGVSIIGLQGIQGIAGPAGNDGAAGAQGIQGIAGPAGNDGAAGAQGIQGIQGVAGNTVLNGVVTPTTEGVNGDFYINTANNLLYGPKVSGAWGAGVSLVGPTGATGSAGSTGTQGIQGIQGIQGNVGNTGAQGIQGIQGASGNTVLSGNVNPVAEGVDGDYYINTSTSQLFGPKAGGVWGSGTSLVGPTGATGATGSQGIQGIQGIQGNAGSAGATGATGATGPAIVESNTIYVDPTGNNATATGTRHLPYQTLAAAFAAAPAEGIIFLTDNVHTLTAPLIINKNINILSAGNAVINIAGGTPEDALITVNTINTTMNLTGVVFSKVIAVSGAGAVVNIVAGGGPAAHVTALNGGSIFLANMKNVGRVRVGLGGGRLHARNIERVWGDASSRGLWLDDATGNPLVGVILENVNFFRPSGTINAPIFSNVDVAAAHITNANLATRVNNCAFAPNNDLLNIVNKTAYASSPGGGVTPSVLKIKTITATAYTFVSDDATSIGSNYIRTTTATATTITVPTQLTAPIPVGAQIPFRQAGAGLVTFAAAAGVTLNAQIAKTLVSAGNGASMCLVKVDTNVWDLLGDFAAV